jgi:penicillin-binding protein 2
MLIFDQLKKSDRQLRLLAICVLCGLAILLVGLWYVQVLSAKRYRSTQISQSFRTIRTPAIRGKIYDANGVVLAENRPRYNVNLYLEELRPYFQSEYSNLLAQLKPHRSQRAALGKWNRYRIVSNVVWQVSSKLGQPLVLDEAKFHEHYTKRLFLPMPVMTNLSPRQMAVFMEQCVNMPGLDLEVQPLRYYPHETTAAHVLGYLRRDDTPSDEEIYFRYPMPDFRGVVGIEGKLDRQLRGKAGVKSVLVNSLGFRQAENVWTPTEPGYNVRLTLDLTIQMTAEKALRGSIQGNNTQGAIVVMDARNGDLLAVASNPAFDPNGFVPRLSPVTQTYLQDTNLTPEINRATQGEYSPGSVFKIVVGLAGLEAGTLNPNETYQNPGYYQLGNRKIQDLAAPGAYNFKRALLKSSNSYFIHEGLKTGVDRLLEIGQRLHFGERTGLPTMQDGPGIFPTRAWQERNLGGAWFDGHTANLCIGQGEIAVTPLQVAVMIAAVANGGTVYAPRLIKRLEPQDPYSDQPAEDFPSGRVRDHLNLKKRTLDLVRDAMHADVSDAAEGTGHRAFVQGMEICAKTGTAQRKRHGRLVGHNFWFASFAPYNDPRYVVVAMVEVDQGINGSGGETCAPLAQQVYLALQKRDQQKPGRPATATPAVASN